MPQYDHRFMGRASRTEALPPWHPDRDMVRLAEIPPLLKRMYNLPVSPDRVREWINKGVSNRKGGRVYLKARMWHGMWMVKKADILAFLEATP